MTVFSRATCFKSFSFGWDRNWSQSHSWTSSIRSISPHSIRYRSRIGVSELTKNAMGMGWAESWSQGRIASWRR